MNEAIEKDEAARCLPDAIQVLIGLHSGDQTNNGSPLDDQAIEARDMLWEEAAERFSPFAENIRGLRKQLKRVRAAKNRYSTGSIPTTLDTLCSMVEDRQTHRLLTDILWMRILNESDEIDEQVVFKEQIQSMFLQLGFSPLRGGMRGYRTLQAGKVVENILVGKLELTTQTQPIPTT